VLLAHQTLVGARTIVDEIWWDRVRMCQLASVILSVPWALGSLVAHGQGRQHSSRQQEMWLVACFCYLHESTLNPLLCIII
jgi:hypothetical protein